MTQTNGHGADEETKVQYVLGELSRAEAQAFEARMAEDAALAAEVRRMKNAFGLIPYASAAEPPPELRAKVLRAAQAAPRARPARRVVWSRFAAATAAALALAFGLDAYRVRSELALQREVTALLQEPNVVRSFSLAAAGAGRADGSVLLDLDAKRGAVVLRGVPALPPEQVYRLWARVGSTDVPCGDFVAGRDGAVRAPFPVPVESYTAPIAGLFVTVEPRAHSGPPTGPRVLESV